ncbi:cation channel sperm-associated auxiliary subunit beta-like [Montipora foliosa]|uniref:cation channel sperm-associated auxiliary subunit beta-like n=1 Tax=Montipora foliosa TaxID=591990 RepID=UPI0035F1D87C
MFASFGLFCFFSIHFPLTLLQTFHSEAFIYNSEEETVQAVLFTDSLSQFEEPHSLLYFSEAILPIRCQLRNRSWDTSQSRNALVQQYADQGMFPTITFISLQCSKSYNIDELVEDDSVYWTKNISKQEVLDYCVVDKNGNVPWTYKVELGKGLDLFESWGTVVFPDIEPLLSIQLGDTLVDSITGISPPKDVVYWQHPCSPAVAVLVPLFNTRKQSFTGCYLAVTHGSFTSNTTHWYDLLYRSVGQPGQYSICKEASFEDCEQLSILDFTLVDNYILLVTTKGLIRSESILNATKGENKTKVKFYQVTNIPKSLDQAFKAGSVTPGRLKFYHTSHCDRHDLLIRKQVSYLIYTDTMSDDETSMLLTSEPPFEEWSSYALPASLKDMLLLGVSWDIQRRAVVLLMKELKKDCSLVAVLDPYHAKLVQPVFRFPDNLTFSRIISHAHTHVIFVYGSQVWLSVDGGNSFQSVLDRYLRGDSVSSLFANTMGDAFVLVTKHGALYCGWSGIPRVSQIESSQKNPLCSFKMASFRHQKSVNIICIKNISNALQFMTYNIDFGTKIREDRIFLFRPLLVTFVSEREVEFSAFCGDAFFSDHIDCREYFHASDVGRILRIKNGGSALITKLKESSSITEFSARAIGDIIQPIPFANTSESPALRYDLEINITGTYAYLQLHNLVNNSGWRGEDIGKTLYLLGGLSLILATCASPSLAIGRLPSALNGTETYVGVFEKGTWFLVDLRPFHAFRASDSSLLRIGQTDNDSGLAEIISDDGKFSFSNEMVGGVLKHNHGWALIISVVSAAVCVIKSDNIKPGNYTDNWGIYKANHNNESYVPFIPQPHVQGWWLAEDECRHFLVEEPLSELGLYHLDSNEKISLTIRSMGKGFTDESPTELPLRAYIGNTFLFQVESFYRMSNMNHTLNITLTKRPFTIGGISSISVRLHHTISLLCKTASYTFHGGCSPTKKLRFLYPVPFSLNDFLYGEVTDFKDIVRNFRIPFNYRAPSSRGKAIPMSENTYNVDPQKPLYKTSYAATRNTLRYKQCKGKTYRSECGCTDQMRGSSLVQHSDCIDTVYRMLFSETLKPSFVVLQEDSDTQALKFPFYLEELNQRQDFLILSSSDLTFSGFSSAVLKQELNSSIQFKGSGLYHFRAYVVQENYTFCSLTDEFIVFIVNTPLPFPVNDIVRACTGMAFASLMIIVYIRYFHGKKKMKTD